MIEDVKLRLVKRKVENRETKEGEVKQVVLVLKGCDLANAVEWSVTLKAEEQMPALYRKIIGAHIGDHIMASLDKGARQTEL